GRRNAVCSLFGQDLLSLGQPYIKRADRLRHHLGDLLIEPGIATVPVGRLAEVSSGQRSLNFIWMGYATSVVRRDRPMSQHGWSRVWTPPGSIPTTRPSSWLV